MAKQHYIDHRIGCTYKSKAADSAVKKAPVLCPAKMKKKGSHSLTLLTPKDPRHAGVPIICCLCHGDFMDYGLFLCHPCFPDKKRRRDEVEDEEEEDLEASWLPGGEDEEEARENAMAAIDFLNNLGDGKKYEFVEGGPQGGADIQHGPMLHINFKAKEKDCPNAQVEMFFAQLRYPGAGFVVVDCCVSLGPSQALKYGKGTGCVHCSDLIHHPTERCKKLLNGAKREDVSWLFGDDYEYSSDSGFVTVSGSDSDSVCDGSPDTGFESDSDFESDSESVTSGGD